MACAARRCLVAAWMELVRDSGVIAGSGSGEEEEEEEGGV